MKCPYTENRVIIIQTKIEYDDTGNQSFVTETQRNIAEMIDCLEENCAAYHNGKCCYYS